MRRIIFIGIWLIVPTLAFAQEVLIVGNVVDEDNVPSPGAFVILKNNHTNNVIKYIATGQSYTFQWHISYNKGDSLFIEASKSGNSSGTQLIVPKDDTVYITLKLLPPPKVLEDVTVTTPSVWTKGDTTNYKVSAFTDGSEKKLFELIHQLPDLDINRQGQLTYKNRPVSKILTNNEDLFSNNLQLLLEQFPAHVIEQIQIIENQSDHTLLQGINNEEKIFMNLKLKKEHYNTAFGNTDIGISTQCRYLFNPTIFSLLHKTKIAFIGNYNTQGYGSDNQLIIEQEPYENILVNRWMLNNPTVYSPDEMDVRHYIRNNLFSNNLKINTRLSSKVQSETQLFYIKDNTPQTLNTNTLFINADTTTEAQTNKHTSIRQNYLNFQQLLKWKPNKQNELALTIRYIHDGQGSEIRNNQLLANKIDTTIDKLNNKNHTFQTHILYVSKLSPTKALKTEVQYFYHRWNQQAQTTADNIPLIFDLPFDDYREIFIARKFEGHTFSSNISYYNRNKKKLYNPNLQVLHQSVNLHNPFVFRDLKGHLNDSSVLALSSSGVWKQTSIQTNYSTSLSYRNTEWGLSGRAGLMHVSAYSRNVTLFTGKASINYKWQQKRHRHFIMATVEQMPHSFHQYNEQLTTLTPTTFNIYRYFDNPVNRQFTVNYLGSTNLKHRVYISLSSMYIRRYQPSVARYAYDRFIQTRYDSAIAYPADRLTGNVKMEMPVLFLKTKLEFSTSVHYLNQYLLLNNRLSKSHNYINNYQLVLKRNWHKTHYLRLSVNLTTLLSKVPSNTTHLNFNSQRIQWRNGLQYQYKMNKVWRLILEGEQITTKSKTQTFAAIGLLHFQLQITPVKSNFSFSILGDNLTNNRTYTFMQASPFMIYNSSVPMVHRNLQLRIHYSF